MKSYWEYQDDMAELFKDQEAARYAVLDEKTEETFEMLVKDFNKACMKPHDYLLEAIEDGRKVEYPLEHFIEDWGMGAFKENILQLFTHSSCIVAQQFKDECAKMYAEDNSYLLAKFNMENSV